MLIGDRVSNNKLYRGIKHYDGLPLTSGDLHEYADLVQLKNSLFTNNIIGSGLLNSPECTVSSGGISLNEPAVILIDGDISLIQADTDIITTTEIEDAGYTEGLICVVGWYQSITSSSTLRSYGGVRNQTLTNDLIDSKFNVQVSTRYQLRWDIILIDSGMYDSGNPISLSLINRDATGAATTGTTSITIPVSSDNVRTVAKPSSMDYSVSDLYIVPIVKYRYSDSAITEANPVDSIKPSGTSFLTSSTEPTGRYPAGTIWYDPSSYRFKFYTPDQGFLAATSELTLIQYHNTMVIDTAYNTPANITMPIGIDSYTANDILQVLYNGVVLTESLHYTVDASARTITLIETTTEIGDAVTFVVIKLVETGSASSIATEFTNHLTTYGSSLVKGHVSLSDAANASIGIERGVAATPKAVYEATTLIDSVTNKKYRLTVTNGVLGIKEVQ